MKPKRPDPRDPTRAAGELMWIPDWWKQDKLMMNYWILVLGFVDVDAALSLELFFLHVLMWQGLVFVWI